MSSTIFFSSFSIACIWKTDIYRKTPQIELHKQRKHKQKNVLCYFSEMLLISGVPTEKKTRTYLSDMIVFGFFLVVCTWPTHIYRKTSKTEPQTQKTFVEKTCFCFFLEKERSPPCLQEILPCNCEPRSIPPYF